MTIAILLSDLVVDSLVLISIHTSIVTKPPTNTGILLVIAVITLNQHQAEPLSTNPIK